MIRKIGQAFVLDTAHTTYAFSILPGGHPEHLYYGRTIHIEHPDDLEILVEKHVFAPGNVNICEKEHAGFSLEDVRLEMSSYGKGDIREPFVEAILYDGAKTLDFRYEERCAGRTSGFLWKCGRSAAAVCDNGGPAV